MTKLVLNFFLKLNLRIYITNNIKLKNLEILYILFKSKKLKTYANFMQSID